MYRVVRRTGDIFGDEPHVCEFVCDTSDDVATLPTSIAEGTGGKSKYDNQKCSAGSTAIIATNSGSNSYILNNSDVWVAQSSGSSGSGGSSETEFGPSITPIGEDGMPYGDVTISEGIKSISSVSGVNARKSCFFANDKVNTVKIPNSMERLGNYGFSYSSLTDVIFDENSNVTEIGTNCFYECVKLTNIRIPKKVTHISGYAFYGNNALTEVTFNADDLTMGDNVFAGCRNLDTLNWGSGIIKLGKSSFSQCSKLTVLSIPNNVISLGDSYTFSACTGITSVIFEEGTPITVIPQCCFYQCTSLTDVVIPSGVITLGNAAFYTCTRMKHITLPNTLTSINCTVGSTNNTFADCTGLETVTLEDNFNCSISLDSCSVLTNAAEMLTKLKDLTGETAKTITFAKAVYDSLTADEIAVATNKNWNVVSYGS